MHTAQWPLTFYRLLIVVAYLLESLTPAAAEATSQQQQRL